MGKDGDEPYEDALARLQLALVHAQVAAIAQGQRTLVIFEGRDGAGKDGAIARITAHLSSRATRVVSLPKPGDREASQWWFQRYVAHLPSAGELVIFNRSWYNRAGVDRVMGFATATQQAQFLEDAPEFERMLISSGVHLVKFWLDISKDEQAKRLKARRDDPLKALKVSDMDAVAQARWSGYSDARDEMLTRTSTALAPWTCVRADHKKRARLNIIRALLHAIARPELKAKVEPPDPGVLFPFETAALTDGRLEA